MSLAARLFRRAVFSPRVVFRAMAGLALLTALVFAWVAFDRAELAAPAPTTIVKDRHGGFLGEVGGTESGAGYWPLATLPPRVAAATLAVEDRRFREHPGVDPLAVARAVFQNVEAGRRVSGASTIAMQVARMQRPESRSYLAKAGEALGAMAITAKFGRDAVLAHYLRIVPYGNRIHGIVFAARRYLDKPVEDLSWAEVAFLTAIPQAPARMNPYGTEGLRAATARGARILALLREKGELSENEYRAALGELGGLRVPGLDARPETAMHAVLRFEKAQRRGELPGGIVTSSIDGELQAEFSDLVAGALPGWEPSGAGNGAMIVVERSSMEVLALVGSSGYFDKKHAGAIDYTRVARSPGSALKPFVYALALDRGTITPATVLDDSMRGPGGVSNVDSAFLGPILPRVALGNSRNVPAVKLVETLGVGEVYDNLGRLGLRGSWADPGEFGGGLAIGAMEVTLEALVRAYGVLSNDGVSRDLSWTVGGAGGKGGERVFTETTARQVTLMLADPMARLPTFPRLGNLELKFPVAIKTGTSSNCRDAWAVGYTRRYLVGAWVGHPDGRPMRDAGGAVTAASLVARALARLQPAENDGQSEVGFPRPREAVQAEVCALSGMLAGSACDAAFSEVFKPGTEPTGACSVHRRMVVDSRDGMEATKDTPSEFRRERVFVDLPPRYADWQKSRGLPPPPGGASGAKGAAASVARWTKTASGGYALAASDEAAVELTSPEPGMRVMRDPETPASFATLALTATVDPPAPQVVWYVDGKPWQVAEYPYTTRWPLKEGRHTFQARVPYREDKSKTVQIFVR